jgi:hypothetical protein
MTRDFCLLGQIKIAVFSCWRSKFRQTLSCFLEVELESEIVFVTGRAHDVFMAAYDKLFLTLNWGQFGLTLALHSIVDGGVMAWQPLHAC